VRILGQVDIFDVIFSVYRRIVEVDVEVAASMGSVHHFAGRYSLPHSEQVYPMNASIFLFLTYSFSNGTPNEAGGEACSACDFSEEFSSRFGIEATCVYPFASLMLTAGKVSIIRESAPQHCPGMLGSAGWITRLSHCSRANR